MSHLSHALFRVFVTGGLVLAAGAASAGANSTPNVAVGARYDTTRVYIDPDQIEIARNWAAAVRNGRPTTCSADHCRRSFSAACYAKARLLTQLGRVRLLSDFVEREIRQLAVA